ncbi:cyclase [Rhizobium sp. KVB221]|uniref:Cyclase n=1 Tax=Rhizobium setariae TaxID=2801340 RepID=A0A936YJF5_9HYPH|nr:cyclase [Rhizobium setariae]MBL0371444.1 cyclase [Rhizobium setariae]
MTTLFVRHSVTDYRTWRKTYDAFSEMQKANGVTAEAVYQSTDDPNDVTVTHEFATLEAAKAFAKLDALAKAMQTGGVVGTPTVWFTQKA